MKEVGDDAFNEEIEQGLVLVDFFTKWCGPCKRMAPILEQFSENNKNIKVLKVDVEESPVVSSKLNIGSVPTLIFFKNRNEVRRLVGLTQLNTLTEVVDKLL